MFFLWLTIVILLSIVEVMTINLTTIWYVVSGIIAIILSFFTDNFLIQLGVFVIVGTILLITTRPILNKFIRTKKESTNFDRIIDMLGIVIEPISKNKLGAVKVDGKIWSAYADSEILVNTTVKVLKIEGAKIKVEEE